MPLIERRGSCAAQGRVKGGYSLSEKENIPLCRIPHTVWG